MAQIETEDKTGAKQSEAIDGKERPTRPYTLTHLVENFQIINNPHTELRGTPLWLKCAERRKTFGRLYRIHRKEMLKVHRSDMYPIVSFGTLKKLASPRQPEDRKAILNDLEWYVKMLRAKGEQLLDVVDTTHEDCLYYDGLLDVPYLEERTFHIQELLEARNVISEHLATLGEIPMIHSYYYEKTTGSVFQIDPERNSL